MRRLMLALTPLLVTAALLSVPACRRKPKASADATVEEAPPLASVLQVADPRASAQLLQGFYSVEQNSWRWTAGKFSVALRPPVEGARHGGTLTLKFVLPDPIIQKLKSVTLTASVGGAILPAETYKTVGEHVYSRDVPPAALTAAAVRFDFSLDKFLPPTQSDKRELGIVVTAVGIDPR